MEEGPAFTVYHHQGRPVHRGAHQGKEPGHQSAPVRRDGAVGQAVLHDARCQPGQGQVSLRDEVPHRLLVSVDAGEGQGQEREGDREDGPEEQLGLEAAQPAGHRGPPHSITNHPRRMASVTASVRLATPSFP